MKDESKDVNELALKISQERWGERTTAHTADGRPLDLDADGRDFVDEAIQETTDGTWYLTAIKCRLMTGRLVMLTKPKLEQACRQVGCMDLFDVLWAQMGGKQ